MLEIVNNSAPLIVDSPESKVVNPGEQVTFVCRVTGEPLPSIKWYFNGVEISRDDLHIEVLISILFPQVTNRKYSLLF